MLDSLRVAAVSLDSRPGGTAENLDKIGRWCRRARGEGAELVLFPELSITGFIPNHPEREHAVWLREALAAARRIAEPVPGCAAGGLSRIAAGSGLFVAAGLLEDAGNLLYNTHLLADPQGGLTAWRKMHIPMFEMPFYNGGPAPGVAATAIGRIGINICFDAFLPESTRLLAVRQAEIVMFPFAADPAPCTPAGWRDWAAPVLRARCTENGVFGVACNYAGSVACAGARQFFPGGAIVLGPRGEVLAQSDGPAGEPDILLADLRAETLREARAEPEYSYRFRRPELYAALAE